MTCQIVRSRASVLVPGVGAMASSALARKSPVIPVPRSSACAGVNMQEDQVRPGVRPAYGKWRIKPLALVVLTCFGLSVGMLHAQTVTGGVDGSVASAGAGVQVTVHNLDTGGTWQRGLDSHGKYTLNSLSPGRYEIQASQNGEPVGQKQVVEVVAGLVTHVPAIGATSLATVNVSAQSVAAGFTSPIDMSKPQISTVVASSLTNALSQYTTAKTVASNFLSSISTNASAYPRFNGASGGEDRYYINGFDTTRGNTGMDLTGIPGEAVASTEIIADTASARYSNATGGSMAQTVKQGSNHFMFGYDMYFTPPTSKLLRPHGRNYRYPDGTWYTYNNGHSEGNAEQYLWASGPIVKDKLFFYALLDDDPAQKSRSMNTAGNTNTVSAGREKRPLVNLTWNITKNQVLDIFDTQNYLRQFSTNYTLSEPYNTGSAKFQNWSEHYYKEKVLIGNYHWYINDDMTLTLMGGHLGNESDDHAYEGGGPFVRQYSLDDRSSQIISANPTSSTLVPQTYNENGYHADFEWTPGDHDITFGAERYKIEFSDLSVNGANGEYHYHEYSHGITLANGVTLPAYTPYVDQMYSRSGGNFYSVNRGAFVQDNWHFARDFVLYMGVRRDQTIGHEINGQPYLNLLTTSPRIGLAWDVFGDGNTKLGAYAGQYTLPMAAGMDSAVGGTSINTTQYFSYSGMNPDGTPIKTGQLGATVTTGSGQPVNAKTIAARNLKNTQQDNFTVYIQHRIGNNWQVQAQAKYDTLKRLVEDTCDFGVGSPTYNYLQSLGYAKPAISNSCILFNPGSSLVLTNDFNGDGHLETVKIPHWVYRMPHVKRKNYQLVMMLTHAYSQDEPWFLNVSYTWSHNYGNDPGVVDDLHGGAKNAEDATRNFDYPQLETGATGDLDLDSRNALKVQGYYKFASTGLRVGGNLNFRTGVPKSCYSVYPNDEQSKSGYAVVTYGNNTFYCFDRLTPRGSLGRLPNYVDMGFFVGWDRAFGHNHVDLSFHVDNPFNWQRQNSMNYAWNNGTYYTSVNSSYGYPGFQGARSVGFVARYTWR